MPLKEVNFFESGPCKQCFKLASGVVDARKFFLALSKQF